MKRTMDPYQELDSEVDVDRIDSGPDSEDVGEAEEAMQSSAFANNFRYQVASIVSSYAMGHSDDRLARRVYAKKLFWLVVGWLILILALVGTKELTRLSDTVLLGLLGAATTAVIGLFGSVVAYLFANRGEPTWLLEAAKLSTDLDRQETQPFTFYPTGRPVQFFPDVQEGASSGIPIKTTPEILVKTPPSNSDGQET